MKSAIFLTVRNKSTRLPDKHFLKIKSKTTIEHLIDRLKLAEFPDQIVLCTSINPDDNCLVNIARKNNIDFFQGNEDDKLDRYLKAAEKFNINFMIIVDGDDLFCDPDYIDMIIDTYKRTNADFITCKGLPFGATPHGIKFNALKTVCDSKKETDTEVWGDYFLKNDHIKKEILKANPDVNYPEFRMSLDYKEDFEFFTKVFELLGDKNTFPLLDIVNLLKNHLEIQKINQHMHEKYERNIKKKQEKILRDIK